MTTPLQDPYPMVELAPLPRAQPLVEPQPLFHAPTDREDDEEALHKTHFALPNSESLPLQAHRESYNLSGSTYLITNMGKTLRLPVPSQSAADPLNWSRRKTSGAIFAVTLFSVVCLTAAQGITVILAGVQSEFKSENIDSWLVKALITGPTLFMGLGCLFWVPLSIGMGRRPALLIASAVVLCAMIWAAEARSFGSLVMAMCFVGLGEGLSLSLALLMVIDLTFINQRPMAIALMWCGAGCFGTSGVALAPVLSDHGHNWRQFFRYWTIPVTISLLVSFVLYPETYFKRPAVAFDGMILLQTATEKLTIYEDVEKRAGVYRDLPAHPLRTGFAGLRDRLGFARSPFASWTSMGRCYLQMGYCAANPLIVWVLIASSFNSASMIYIGSTYARVLIAPPYNVSSDIVGTVNVASGVGSLLGFLVWSCAVSKVVTHLSRRNRGVLEAEHYLVGYVVPTVTGALSSLLYGMAVNHKWPKEWMYFAYGLNGMSYVMLMVSNTLWVTGAFPRWAAPALAVVGGGCYLLAFAMSFALEPWIEAQGHGAVGIQLAAFQILGGLVALPVAFWGKSARQAIQGRWADDRSGALRPL